MTVALPETTSPAELAQAMGWSERRVRDLARAIGACRILGNRMVLLPDDVVVILKATQPNITVNDVKDWLAADSVEIVAEKEAQAWATPTGHVYFVQRNNSEVKIGYTTDIDGRLAKFRSASPDTFSVLLMIAGTISLEKYFHQKFSSERIVREWFRLDGPIREFIGRRRRTMRGTS